MLVTDNIDDLNNPDGSFMCPTCSMMPEVQGPTNNCLDPEGCGMYGGEPEDEYMEDEEDMGVDELDFE